MANTTISTGGPGVAVGDAKRRSWTSASAATQQLVHGRRDVTHQLVHGRRDATHQLVHGRRAVLQRRLRGGATMERSSPAAELQWSARRPRRSFNGALARRRRSCNGALVARGGAAMECSSPAAELQWSAPMQHSHEGSRCFIAMLAGGSMQRRRRHLGEFCVCNEALLPRLGVDAVVTTRGDAALRQLAHRLPKVSAAAALLSHLDAASNPNGFLRVFTLGDRRSAPVRIRRHVFQRGRLHPCRPHPPR